MVRPVLIDEQDGACEICAGWRENTTAGRSCNACGDTLEQYLNMQGNGFQSPVPHHFHLRPVLGVNGRESIFAEYCVDCYLDAFKEKYPKAPLPDSVAVYSKKHKKEERDVTTDLP